MPNGTGDTRSEYCGMFGFQPQKRTCSVSVLITDFFTITVQHVQDHCLVETRKGSLFS